MYPHHIRLRGPWEFRTLDGPSRAGTMTVPGFWHEQGLADYWGRIELRRPFNWLAKLSGDECVWLCVDGCVGRSEISLNGSSIGGTASPWGIYRFDVTRLLRSKNELRIELEATEDEPNRFGTLGCSSESNDRSAVGGILGGVHLAVESRRLSLRVPTVQTAWTNGVGGLSISAHVQGNALDHHYIVLLNGEPLETQVEMDESIGRIMIRSSASQVEPWQPRLFGKPALHELRLSCLAGKEVLFEQDWTVGFRSMSVDDSGCWKCNGQEVDKSRSEIWPAQSFATLSDENLSTDHELADGADVGWRHIVGHFAPRHFYDLCDQQGWLIEQDLPECIGKTVADVLASSPSPESEIVARTAAHPSVCRWSVFVS